MDFIISTKLLIIFLLLLFSLSLRSQKQEFKSDEYLNEIINSIKIAKNYATLNQYDSSIYYYNKASSIIGAKYDIRILYQIYYGICIGYLNLLVFDSSLFYAQNAYSILISQSNQNNHWKLQNLEKTSYMLGHLYSINNEYDLSLYHYFEGVKYIDTLYKIDSTYERNYNLSWYYLNIGSVYNDLGYYDKSIDYYNMSIDLQKKLKKESEIYLSYSYLNIAEILISKGDYHLALIYYQYLNNIYENYYGPNSLEVAIVNNNIGLIYFNIGNYAKSLNYFNKAMNIAIDQNKESNEIIANIYNNVADVYRKLKKYEFAQRYFHKALFIYQTLFDSISLENAFVFNNIANLHKDKSEFHKALTLYQRSLFIRSRFLGEKHDKISQIYQNIGLLYLFNHDFDSALKYFQSSIISNIYEFNDTNIYVNPGLSSTVISKIELLETLVYKSEALIKLSLEFPEGSDTLIVFALKTFDLAIKLSDYLIFDYQSEQSRLIMNSKISLLYTYVIKHLLCQFTNRRKLEKAFEYCERSKNIILFSNLNEKKAKTISGIPNEIIEKEKEIKSLLDNYQIRIHKEEFNDTLSITKYERKIFELSVEYESLISDLKNNYPVYYDLRFKYHIPSIKEIQHLLTSNQALINYYYLDSSIYIFSITNDTILLFTDTTLFSLKKDINTFIKSINLIHIKESYKSAYSLYLKLISPIENIISNKKELILIPYGILYYVPFEALVKDRFQENNLENVHFIIEDHIIKYHYSTTLWYYGYKESLNKLNMIDYTYEFSGFAPVFTNNNSNLSFQIELDSNNKVLRFNNKERIFSPLPHSGNEVSSIYYLFIENEKKAKKYLQNYATEENFKLNLSNVKYLHIATHGFIDILKPFLSGLIFYEYNIESKFTNNQLSELKDITYNDGILYLNELANLDISAELVILSACETGIGKLEDSEGVISMARGLISAGVDNIIISLFKVPDKHTKDLMLSFYKNLIKGYSFAEALRQAKLELIHKNFLFPKLWSSFILIGK